MSKKVIVIENPEDRNYVREQYKNAHCRPVKHSKGFEVFYMDQYKRKHQLGYDSETRVKAWKNAVWNISGAGKLIEKLES